MLVKHMLFALILLTANICYSGDILDKKININQSLEEVFSDYKDVPENIKEHFGFALDQIVAEEVNNATLLVATGMKTEAQIDKTYMEEKVLSHFAGKTVREVLEAYPQPPQIELNKPFSVDGVEITLKSVIIGKLQPKNIKDLKDESNKKPPNQEFLIIKVSLKNTSEGKIVSISDTWEKSVLTDNYENNFGVKNTSLIDTWMLVDLVDFAKKTKIMPSKVIEDSIIFERPLDNAKTFTVTLEPRFYKSLGNDDIELISSGAKYRFNFSKKSIINTD